MQLYELVEALTTMVPIDWKTDGVGFFEVNNQQFRVQFKEATAEARQTYLPFFEREIKVANIDFERVFDDGSTTQDLTGESTKESIMILSTIANAAKQQMEHGKVQILLAVAKRRASPTNFERRVSAYDSIVNYATRKSGLSSLKIMETPDEVVFAVFIHTMWDGIEKVQQYMREHGYL